MDSYAGHHKSSSGCHEFGVPKRVAPVDEPVSAVGEAAEENPCGIEVAAHLQSGHRHRWTECWRQVKQTAKKQQS